MQSVPSSLTKPAQLLLEILSACGMALATDSWNACLRHYSREAGVRLPDTLSDIAAEMERAGVIERQGLALLARHEATEAAILQTRAERRAGFLSNAIYEALYPLIQNPFDKANINFRLALLFSSSRYLNPYFLDIEGNATKSQELYRIGRGWKRPESFAQVEARWRPALVEQSLEWAAEHLEEAPGVMAFLEQQHVVGNEVLLFLGQYLLARGEEKDFAKLAAARARVPSLAGVECFLKGQFLESLEFFQQAVVRTGSQIIYLPLARMMRVLALLHQEELEAAERCCSVESKGIDPWLRWLCDQRQGKSRHARPEVSEAPMALSEWLSAAASALALDEADLKAELVAPAQALLAKAQGFPWAAQQLQALLGRMQDGKAPAPPWDAIRAESGWKRRLGQLLLLAQKPLVEPEERLIWSVAQTPKGWEVTPKHQTQGKKGGWTKGRSLDLHRHPPPCADEHDKAVFRLVLTGDHTPAKILLSLVGHPRVFHGDSGQPMEILEGHPEFQVHEVAEGLRVRIEPPCLSPTGIAVHEEGLSTLKVYRYDQLLRQFSEILGAGLEVPTSEQASVQTLLDHLPAGVAVASDLATAVAAEVEADCSLVMRIRPWREGLELNLLVRPLGSEGPEYPPTQGGQRVLAKRQGIRLQAVRDLERERALWDELLRQCPTLAKYPNRPHWALPDVQSSLEVLEELGQLAPELLSLEWPEGQSLRVRQRVSGEAMTLTVKGRGDWFSLQGEINMSADQQWKLEKLLDHLRNSPGRFVSLGQGEFLALTEDFRKRLQDLSSLLEESKEGLRLPALAAGMLAEIPGIQGDRAFQERLRAIEEMEQHRPEVPPTFQAELRNYQIEGYQWLAQRAHWGVGACLSDDMGLGKTLQALALLVHRAPGGPALVVAPTSVCGNWMEEARRFAPSLRLQWLAEADRAQVVEEADSFDVVVVSYGVLARESELMTSRRWHTLVLDEAQAIKNHATQRFANVLKLESDFRFLTTGTPVENSLEELWALFRFLNPGLLGSLGDFRLRYITPIEAGDSASREQLRRLVHPFLLRRTKRQVLTELPARTDIRLDIELSESERTFYEALRQRALEKLEDGEVEAMAVLAELSRLRRACCNPHLVDPAQKPEEGSKLEALRELLGELRAGGHRALIFSQYVDHLTLLRQELEKQQISYQYLDGGTPAQERTRRVRQFQAGEGEVFLISLRAGGFGLNLTAADYVIHMDPWWNPAVEDQASDRAHRMGQRRPVTVYRLVAKDTVEEKILALHQHKRDLADGLLEGAEQGMKLSAKELLQLMRD